MWIAFVIAACGDPDKGETGAGGGSGTHDSGGPSDDSGDDTGGGGGGGEPWDWSGEAVEGDVDVGWMDLVGCDVVYDGSIVSVTFHLAEDLPPYLTVNQPELDDGELEYEWAVYFDTDADDATGCEDRSGGEQQLAANRFKDGDGPIDQSFEVALDYATWDLDGSGGGCAGSRVAEAEGTVAGPDFTLTAPAELPPSTESLCRTWAVVDNRAKWDWVGEL